jgi:TPR repeat protein
MKWYRKAADQGYTPAMREIGDIYEHARGTKMDLGEAERWYRRAADLDDADAMVALGKLLTPERPIFRPRDEAQAARWFRKAADQGHALGMYHLAEAYKYGHGVPQDKAAALEWYRRAGENGNGAARNMAVGIEGCMRRGMPVTSCM